jgi:hypothetical protein
MFPDTTKANQELGGVLAYIALFRRAEYSSNKWASWFAVTSPCAQQRYCLECSKNRSER